MENIIRILNDLDMQIAILDGQGTIKYVNNGWKHFAIENGAPIEYDPIGVNYLQICRMALIDTSFNKAGDIADAQTAFDGLTSILYQGQSSFEFEYGCPSPIRQRYFAMHAARMRDLPEHILILHFETTKIKKQIDATQERFEELYLEANLILDNIADAVFLFDHLGDVKLGNRSAVRLFEIPEHGTLKSNILDLLATSNLEEVSLNALLNTSSREFQLLGRKTNGETFPMEMQVSSAKIANRIVYVATIRDSTSMREKQHEIERLAYYDSLTGLANRSLIYERIQHSLAATERTDSCSALMLLDLDQFKLVNDSFGHDVGDLLLREVAKRLQLIARKTDTIGRMGGDEFIVLLEHLTSDKDEAQIAAESIGRKILASIETPIEILGRQLRTATSIGVIVFKQENGTNGEDLLKRCDLAMYEAKKRGRNQLCTFDKSFEEALLARMNYESEIANGLKSRQFLAHYQAQVDSDGAIIGYEALARWEHPKFGIISPINFIPAAEATNLIIELGKYILMDACLKSKELRLNQKSRPIKVAVNVSAVQFAHIDYVQSVIEVLHKSETDPENIKLELTESALLTNVDEAIYKMNSLRAIGISFSLDDFGTGFSSLSYLKKLPLDQLKIDKSFVKDISNNESDLAIARAVIALGKSLGLAVIAEGIETRSQYLSLIDIGCTAFQGYYFGRPGLL